MELKIYSSFSEQERLFSGFTSLQMISLTSLQTLKILASPETSVAHGFLSILFSDEALAMAKLGRMKERTMNVVTNFFIAKSPTHDL